MTKFKNILIALLLISAFITIAGTVLDKNSNITISVKGPFDNTVSLLEKTLTKYICAKLRKSTLSGTGGKVAIELVCKGKTWRDLDLTKFNSIQELDGFTIDTRQADKIVITGYTPMGASYGLFYFIENYLDVFWLFPGKLGECIKPVEKIEIPTALVKKKPECINRIYTGMTFRDPQWIKGSYYSGLVHSERSFFWSYDYQKNLKLHHLYGASHNMINIFPVEESKKLYPEIFPILKNGKRFIPPTKKDGTHSGREQGWGPCYTNEKTIEVATKKALEYFKARKGLLFSLGINDGVAVDCHCAKCKKMGFPESYYYFVNRVAKNVKKYSPPFMLGVLAYGAVGIPPKNLKLEDNVLVNCTSHLHKWLGVAKKLSVYQYQYGWGYWVPNFTLKAIVNNAKKLHKDGVIGYRAEVHPLWAFYAPKVYVLSNMLWNSNFDANAAIEKFCRVGYGKAWKEILGFYKLWIEHHNHSKVGIDGLLPTWGGGKTFRHSTEQFDSVAPNVYPAARAKIEKAKQLVQDEKVKKRIEMIDAFFTYSETYYKTFLARRDIFEYSPDKNWNEEQKKITSLLNKRKQLVASMEKHPEWFLGSRQTIKEILHGKMWERRWEWNLDYEGDCALLTADYQVNKNKYKAVPLKFSVKMSPWRRYYHPHIYNGMKAKNIPGGAKFNLRAKAQKKVNPRSPYKAMSENGLKKHWFRGNIKAEQGKKYLFKINLEGKEGVADIHIANENDCGKQIHLVQRFGKNCNKSKKQLLLTPTKFWGHTRPVKNLSVSIIFTPNSTKGGIKGTCTMEKIDFKQ